MSETEVLDTIDEFKILVVDDDPVVCERVRDCLEDIPKIEMKGIEQPEAIENLEVTKQVYSLVILDIVFQNERNAFVYLIRQVKKRWPDAVTMVLSNYTPTLTEKQKKSVDIVLNKGMFRVDSQVFIDKFIEMFQSHKVNKSPASKEVLRKLSELNLTILERDLYKMTGYVLGQKGEYIEAAVYEEDPEGHSPKGHSPKGHRWRKILMLASLFTEKGLEGLGTPFVFRIFPAGGNITTTVELNPDEDEQADIPDDIKELLARLDEQDERLRRESANDK